MSLTELIPFFQETDLSLHQIVPDDDENLMVEDYSVPSELFYAKAARQGISIWVAIPSGEGVLNQLTFVNKSSNPHFPQSLPKNMQLEPPVTSTEDELGLLGDIFAWFEEELIAASTQLPQTVILVLAQPTHHY